MSTIAIIGASSQIAKDLIRSFVAHGGSDLLLYVRDLTGAALWLEQHKLGAACSLHPYEHYGQLAHEVVINFVGVGDPRRAAEMGASIFEITARYDDMVLAGLAAHPERRYLFLSSGAAYGNSFSAPVDADTAARIAINAIAPQDYYATAKLHAEVRHRSRPDLAIVDLRVFNYFSRTQDMDARFFITDIVRAVRDGQTLQTTGDHMVRDFLHPEDFHQLVACIIAAPPSNCALDCYTSAPIDKSTLLAAMQQHFGLRYEIVGTPNQAAVNATGAKPHYYSRNRKAAQFGYQPRFSSLDGLLTETAAILG